MSDELEQLKADLEVLERYHVSPDITRHVKESIVRAEADADPWLDVKRPVEIARQCNAGLRTTWQQSRRLAEYIDNLNAEIARLTERVAELEAAAKAEDDEDLGDAEKALANLKAFVSEFPPRPPFEGPIESIEPILDPARVLATARWFLNNSDKDIHGTIAYLIAFHCGDSSKAKPYKLKGGEE